MVFGVVVSWEGSLCYVKVTHICIDVCVGRDLLSACDPLLRHNVELSMIDCFTKYC